MYKNSFTDFLKKRNKRKHANSTGSQFNKHLDVYRIRVPNYSSCNCQPVCLPQLPARQRGPFVFRGLSLNSSQSLAQDVTAQGTR